MFRQLFRHRFRPLLIALQFLTVLPVRINGEPDAKETGWSLPYYPLVGLLVGAQLAATAWLLGEAPPSLAAALLLTIWVALTGALHLDGLADVADAWVGGMGDRDKTLAIMKDSRSGPMAVVTLVLVLVIKFAALVQILSNGVGWWSIILPSIILVPVLGRTALVLLFLTTPYVRPQGLGSVLASHMPRRACAVTVVFTLLAIVFFFGWQAAWLLAAAGGTFFTLRRLMLRRIKGNTGDTSGALVELTETAALLTTALMN